MTRAQLRSRCSGDPRQLAALRTLMGLAEDAEIARFWNRPLFWERMSLRWLRVDPARPKQDADQFASHVCAALGLRRTPVEVARG